MSKTKIIITIDYEIFGDGSGTILDCMIKPTEKILDIANNLNIPITLFLEFCEFNAFKKESERLFEDNNPKKLLISQLINAIKNNHDIQLHIHPQWIKYDYNFDLNKWDINKSKWRTSSLGYNELLKIFKESKEEIESIIKPIKNDYECFVFRAGAFSIQPEKEILKALADSGFLIDTTVLPNKHFNDGVTYYDFRKAPQKLFWRIEDNIIKEIPRGKLIEYPVSTRKYNFFQKLIYKILRKLKKTEGKPKGCIGDPISRASFSLKNIFFPTFHMFDVCSMSDIEMLNFIKSKRKEYRNFNDITLVVIGHSKMFKNFKNFAKFIIRSKRKGYEFIKFKDVIKDEKN